MLTGQLKYGTETKTYLHIKNSECGILNCTSYNQADGKIQLIIDGKKTNIGLLYDYSSRIVILDKETLSLKIEQLGEIK